MFIDRLDQLSKKIGYVVGLNPSDPIHHILDALDKAVGISTRHGCAAAYHAGRVPFPQAEYVGARLARLERHVSASKAPALFWLGAEGDTT